MAFTRPVQIYSVKAISQQASTKAERPDCLADDLENVSKRAQLKSERCRLQTYKGWPPWSNQLPEKLAEAGLYYTGVSDRVQCPFCFGVLKNWNVWDVPIWEHRQHFPYCKFIQGHDVGNITKGVEIESRKQHPTSQEVSFASGIDFTREINRFASFSRWPRNRTQTPESLARAGFFHIPSAEKKDRVMCAYCRGKLHGWNFGDDPWLEHARIFPTCLYIQLCVGQDVINDLIG